MNQIKEQLKEDIGKLLIRERNRDTIYLSESPKARKTRWDDLYVQINSILDRNFAAHSEEYSANNALPSASSLSTA